MLFIQIKPRSHKTPDPLVGAIHIRRIKGKAKWVRSHWVCCNGPSIGIPINIFIKRVIGPGYNEGVSFVGRPVKKVLYTAIDLKPMAQRFSELNILYTPPWRPFPAGISFT